MTNYQMTDEAYEAKFGARGGAVAGTISGTWDAQRQKTLQRRKQREEASIALANALAMMTPLERQEFIKNTVDRMSGK